MSLTILTEPSTRFSYRVIRWMKVMVKKRVLRRPIPRFAGHYAVVRSICAGLDEIGYNYNYNPTATKKLGSHVHVLAGVNTLQHAIELKRKGKIKTLTAGPNIVISSSDEGGIIAAPEIDKFFTNSDWVYEFYLLNNPNLENRLGIWAAGVDAESWKIEKKNHDGKVALFYKKRPEHFLYEACKALAGQAGFVVREVIYGSYTPDSLRTDLETSDVVVYFVEQESQGIALQEIWATDTPVFVWNPQLWMYRNVNYRCSSAPYMTASTGLFFKDAEEFRAVLQQPLDQFQPRNWLLENMTDRLCAMNFIKDVVETKDGDIDIFEVDL